MKKLTAIVTAAVALCLVAVTVCLGVKFRSANSSVITAEESSVNSFFGEVYSGEPYQTETGVQTYVQPVSTESTAVENISSVVFSSSPDETETATTAEIISEITEKMTEAVTTVTTTRVATTVNEAFNKVFSMPRTPKYVQKETKIDYAKASLASYKYDPDGNYYYTDDKNAWQKGFGYNQVYDKLAVASAMYYDTVRNTFTYGGKDWLIQFWKGQYGYYFVGSEIGVYTRKAGTSGTYACADKQDWLKMEMCFIWDEYKDGSYKPVFKRPYNEYWWCTGFVIGFESKESLRSRQQFRLVAHITFKDDAMAELFCNAMKGNGFREVSSLDNSVIDTFVHVGPDVGFVWQNINQHVI